MADFEASIEALCKAHALPGIVLAAVNKDGKFKYNKTFGSHDIDPSQTDAPIASDSVMWLASCSKLQTSIAILQCVERGQINLDEDLVKFIPELHPVGVLTGWDDKKPIVKKREGTITLRRALTHSSGIGYSIFDPVLQAYLESKGDTETMHNAKVLPRVVNVPLLFEPGTNWTYGFNIDIAGRLVEILNNTDLESYMQKNIWGPLGIKDMTFWLDKRPDMLSRLAGMTTRTGEDLVPSEQQVLTKDALDCFGGHGLYGTIPEYLKIMHSILADDGKLLKSETINDMFSPQLEPAARDGLAAVRQTPFWDMVPGIYPEDVTLDYGLGSMLSTKADPLKKADRTLMWSGLPNLVWFIDRGNGLCAMFGTQVIPQGDLNCRKATKLFEDDLYQKYEAFKKSA